MPWWIHQRLKIEQWISWSLTYCSFKSCASATITLSAERNIDIWFKITVNNKSDLIKMFAEIRFARKSPASCCWLRRYPVGETKPHLQQMYTECEQLYKSCATNPATSKPDWLKIAFTKGSFQVHRLIDLVHTHPLLGSSRKSCSGANVVLSESHTR